MLIRCDTEKTQIYVYKIEVPIFVPIAEHTSLATTHCNTHLFLYAEAYRLGVIFINIYLNIIMIHTLLNLLFSTWVC